MMKSKTKMIVVQQHKCMACMQEAETIKAVERLPDGGILWKAKHVKGTHMWAEHPSLFIQKKERLPTRIKCPKCNKLGRVNYFHPDGRRSPYRICYYIAHEQVKDGSTWGKNKSMKKMRRCYFYGKKRDAILKKLGRFISS